MSPSPFSRQCLISTSSTHLFKIRRELGAYMRMDGLTFDNNVCMYGEKAFVVIDASGRFIQVQPAKPVTLVISGPSGVGKDYLVSRLQKSRPDLHFVVTATTRCASSHALSLITHTCAAASLECPAQADEGRGARWRRLPLCQ